MWKRKVLTRCEGIGCLLPCTAPCLPIYTLTSEQQTRALLFSIASSLHLLLRVGLYKKCSDGPQLVVSSVQNMNDLTLLHVLKRCTLSATLPSNSSLVHNRAPAFAQAALASSKPTARMHSSFTNALAQTPSLI